MFIKRKFSTPSPSWRLERGAFRLQTASIDSATRRLHSLKAGTELGIALAVLVASALGCGKPAYQLETAPVRGTVTLDGAPLPSGYVVAPTTRGRMASGKIQTDGSFVLSTYEDGDGAQVGTHPVIVNEVPPDEFSLNPDERVAIPSRYTSAGTSGLTIDVKPGEDNVLELKLTTKPQ